ncbi:fatty acid desaturase [Pseudonocardia alni]|uniref:fatty acid desaturase n=1 Tax=Pseudonocardia alni TaxID=33907 RepID=UPI00279C24A3|nr:2Fe-2S iron-sulfur cluster binding domain-containing protein [Pseudonocardia alni]
MSTAAGTTREGAGGDRPADPGRPVPTPGITLPVVALPTLALFLGSLAAWVGATALVLTGTDPWRYLVTVPVHALVTFAMFTVLHETVHLAGGRLRWVNEVLGRLSMLFVVAWAAFPMLRYLHIEHHRNTNEDTSRDPDAWTESGPAWSWPLRWMTIDLWYVRFYLPRIPSRPRAELVEQAVVFLVVVSAFVATAVTGHGWELLVIYLIPQRLGIALLAWWFDWLPHHDLGETARSDRFAATRMRVGWERLVTPLMLGQNYHLVHHIHPTVPFYRYQDVWRRAMSDWLDRPVPITTVLGSDLSPAEYRAWRRLTSHTDRDADLPTRPHPLRVTAVDRLTPDAVAVTLEVPGELRDVFAHRPGRHVTVGTRIDGELVRRSYSICSTDGSALRIAVRRVDGGRFSTWVGSALAVGDTLEVTPPSGQFVLPAGPSGDRTVAAVAAGSGITPVIAILTAALDEDPDRRAVLLYANRDTEHTMFADELDELVRRSGGRLTVVHHHSRSGAAGSADGSAPDGTTRTVVPGRLGADRFAEHLTALPVDDADWFLCGPPPMLDELVGVLDAHGVTPDRVHREFFVAPTGDDGDAVPTRPAVVTVRRGGRETVTRSRGTASLLETALEAGVEAPYLCAGGICGTCRAQVVTGAVHMQQNYALTDDEVACGAILTCQSRPTTDEVTIDYDR